MRTPIPSPLPAPDAESPATVPTSVVADGWSARWGGISATSSPETGPDPWAPEAERRPRVTHLVLVDGLPADHWVEEGADAPRAIRPRGRSAAPSTSERAGRGRELRWLDELVGGRAALLDLDDLALAPRGFEAPDLDPELRARAVSISAECDRLAVEVFGCDELATALRRLWEAVLVADPGMLARSARDDTAVGALVWAAAQANALLGPEGLLLARELWPRLGVPASAAGRGTALLERLAPGTGALLAPPGAPRLRATGRPDVLLAATRAMLVVRRDELLPTGHA